MDRRSRAYIFVLFLVGLGLCASAAPAGAFWPYTTTRASGDTVSAFEWEARFSEWRDRRIDLRAAKSETSVMDSIQALLESQNLRLSPSELARMAALAKQQQEQEQRQGPPQPPQPASPRQTTADSLAQFQGADSLGSAESTSVTATDPFAADSTQADPFGPAPADTLTSPASDPATPLPNVPQQPNPAMVSALAGRGISPNFNSRLTSSNDRMNLTTTLATTAADASGVTVTSTLSYGEIISLTQNTTTQNSSINNALLLPWARYGLNFNLSTTNSASERIGRSITNARTRNLSNNKGSSLSANGSRQLMRGIRANAFYARNFSQNDQFIQGTTGGSSGDRDSEVEGNSFGFGGNFDRIRWLQVRGRYGRSSSNNIDRSASFVTDENPAGEQSSTSSGDSASVNVNIPRAGWFSGISIDFQMQSGQESFSDVARTSSGGIASDTEFALETKRNFRRSLRMRAGFAPLSFLSSEMAFGAARDSVSYKLRPNQFRDNVRIDWSISTTLTYMTGGSVTLNYEEDRADVDQDEPSNPANPQTREEESRSLSLALNHSFTESFKVRAYGDVGLTQEFYRHEGPQGLADRDQLRTRVGMDVDGRISGKATARVQMYARTYDQSFIDVRRSFRSRNETEYVVRPSFTYQITDDILLTQFYGLSSKVLDEIFNPRRNTLNRNHFLQTRMVYDMTDRLQLEARWEYLLQDNGFYVDNPNTPVEDRVFAPSARTKKDEVKLSMRYQLIKDGVLTFTSENVATREHTGVTVTNVAERGNIALGLDSRINVGKLSLNTRASRNQSFNVTLNRNVFYNVDSTLSYAF